MLFNRLSAVAFLLLSPVLSRGQELRFTHLGIEDGLPSSEVYYAQQDSRGFLWFSTDAGVSRYNGYHFETFTIEDGLTDNTVLSSHEDSKGRIWFRPISGKLCYYENGKFHSIGANDTLLKLKHKSYIIPYLFIQGDTLFGSLGTQGYFRIAPPYGAREFYYDSLADYRDGAKMLLEKGGSVMWLPLSGKSQPWLYLGLQGRPPVKVSTGLHLYSYFNAYCLRRKQDILYASFKNLLQISPSGESRSYTFVDFIIGLREDRAGNLWVGTSNGALLYPEGNLDRPPVHLLKGFWISSIEEDNEGGYWLTTLSHGVHYLASKEFRYYEAGDNFNVISIAHSPGKGMLAGLKNGTLWLIRNDSLEQIHLPAQPTYAVRVIHHFRGSNWIATDRSILALDSSLKQIHEVLEKDAPIYNIKSLAAGSRNHLWAINKARLYRIDGPGRKLDKVLPSPFERPGVVYEDRSGRVWVGYTEGLARLEGDRLVPFRPQVLRQHIVDIGELPDKKGFCAATKTGGLCLIRGDSVQIITTKHGLVSNSCKSLLTDSSTIWVGTNKGLSRITLLPKGFTIENYSSRDGLLSDEVNAICRAEGRIWLATSKGVVAFDSRKVRANKVPPGIHLTGISVNGKTTSRTGFEHHENYMSFSFVGISYKSLRNITYKYRLMGVDKSWQYTTNTSVQYQALAPGSYTFLVYAVNSSFISSLKPSMYQFTIAPPFWKTWWFMLLLTAAGVLSLLLIIRYRVRALQRKVKEKTELSRRIAALEMKALRSQMNPHFIFNSLNAIQHYILKDNGDTAQYYLTKFSKLIRNVLENSKYALITVGQEVNTLELYIELESLRFREKFDYTIDVENREEIKDWLIPSMLIQPFVENAIWHGLMHKPSKGTLLLKIFCEEGSETLRCVVEDDGIGRQASLRNKGRNVTHQSIGISNTRERLETLNSIHQTHSAVTITDLYTEDGKAAGTRVEILIPLKINSLTITL
jgi:sensor histidine kinase YesM